MQSIPAVQSCLLVPCEGFPWQQESRLQKPLPPYGIGWRLMDASAKALHTWMPTLTARVWNAQVYLANAPGLRRCIRAHFRRITTVKLSIVRPSHISGSSCKQGARRQIGSVLWRPMHIWQIQRAFAQVAFIRAAVAEQSQQQQHRPGSLNGMAAAQALSAPSKAGQAGFRGFPCDGM